jgi:hypothetical protein
MGGLASPAAVLGIVWSTPVCGVCRAPSVTVDLVCGHRCADHPPAYSPAYVAGLLRWGMPGTAAAYYRTHVALLQQRIAIRAQAHQEVA